MGNIAVDQLKDLGTLKVSGISESQARAHTRRRTRSPKRRTLATRSDLDARVREAELRLEAKIEASRSDIIKCSVSSVLAQGAVIVALLKLLP